MSISQVENKLTVFGFTVDSWAVPGSIVYIKSSHSLFPNQSCTITQRPSPDAVIVEMDSGLRERISLKYLQPLCCHQFIPVWQSDSTLIERCNCGATQAASLKNLQSALDDCCAVKKQYADAANETGGERRQEMLEAVAQQTRQIEWLTEQLKTVSVQVPVETCEDIEVVENDLVATTSKLSLAELAVAINSSHHRCQEAYRSSLLEAQRAGAFLLAAKAKVKELTTGRWLVWLTENCPEISKRTAQAYMQIARDWKEIEKSATVALFGFKDALKYLAAVKKNKKPIVSKQSTQSHGFADKYTSDSSSQSQTSAKMMDDQWLESPLQEGMESNCNQQDIERAFQSEKLQDLLPEPKSKNKQLLPTIEPNPGMPPTELLPTPAALANTSVLATATNPAVLATELTIGVLSNKEDFNRSQVKAIRDAMIDLSNPDELAETMERLSDEKFSALLARIQPRIRRMGVLA